jgi:hypothetical protein
MKVERLKLYAIAIFAFKPDPEHTVTQRTDGSFTITSQNRQGEDATFESTPGLGVSYDTAVSEEEVRESAMLEAKRMYPEGDGYMLHFVNVVEVSPAAIMDAAASLHEEMQPATEEKPEREM